MVNAQNNRRDPGGTAAWRLQVCSFACYDFNFELTSSLNLTPVFATLCRCLRWATHIHVYFSMAQQAPSPSHILRVHSLSQINVVTFSKDNERLYSGDLSGKVVVTSTRTLRSIAEWQSHNDGLLGVQEWGENVITYLLFKMVQCLSIFANGSVSFTCLELGMEETTSCTYGPAWLLKHQLGTPLFALN